MMFPCMLILIFLSQVCGHSWMSCPKSFSTFEFRGGTQTPPCERWYLGADNDVIAGDRLKVGWTSNNHGGGYVRISLIKATTTSKADFFGATEAAFKQNVIKFACYGHDTRKGRTKFGDCIHPCNGRPGCEYQMDIGDVERLDTTITIPTNLKDGLYILQTAMLVGNSQAPYFGCAKINIQGGDTTLNCKSNDPPPRYKCHRAGGPPIDKISQGTKRGEFCYHSDKRGEVDDRINEEPVNVECDPRIFCGVSVNSQVCYQEKGMRHLDSTPRDPKQPNCRARVKTATCTDRIKNQGETGVDCGGPCPKKCPTCTDGIKNQNEDGIDCGGPCAACPTCFDGIKNQFETGVDCGGPCKPCAQCTDGIKNQGETGIDCGGPCPACATCTDGIQNQGEGGIDCGGPCCNTCTPTCTDNIQNQGETGVDCGGPCKPCNKGKLINYVTVSHVEKDFGSGPIHITIIMTFKRNVRGRWKFRVEYNQKIDLLSSCGAAKHVETSPGGTIFTFEMNHWGKLPRRGGTRRIYLLVTKTDVSNGVLKPTGEFFEVVGQPDLGLRLKDEKYRKDENYKKGLGPNCGVVGMCKMGEACMRKDIHPCTKRPCEWEMKCVGGLEEVVW